MSFPATIMIQGAANFVPHTDGRRLLVLFPRQDTPEASLFRGPNRVPIPPHESFLHVLGSNLNPEYPAVWTTMALGGHWIIPRLEGNLPPLDVGKDTTAGIPSLAEVLEEVNLGAYSALNPRVLPGGGEVAVRLKAGLHLDQGVFGMDQRWASRIRFGGSEAGSNRVEMRASNTWKIELGNVEKFALVFRPFTGGKPRDLVVPLHPVAGRLEVWIRHICEMQPPTLPKPIRGPAQERADTDFVLNYILRDDAPALAKAFETIKPPIPYLVGSWVSSDITGPEWPQCLGAVERPTEFATP